MERAMGIETAFESRDFIECFGFPSLGHVLRRDILAPASAPTPPPAGIIRDATAELARHRTAQANIRVRNPKTNALRIALRTKAAVAGSRSEGRSRLASLNALA